MARRDLRESRYPQRDRNAEGRAENARPRDRYGRPLPRGSVDEMADKLEPEEAVGSVDEALEHAIGLFDERRFFEAHEFLEFIWKSEDVDESDRNFWKGVTQVAVGCCHTQRGNDDGAVTLLERAIRYVSPYPPHHRGVATDELVAAARNVAQQVRGAGASPDVDFPTFPRAPRP